MKKIERLIGIICALNENKKLTAKELSKIFEVSERTIYRDIDALSQLNVPIKAFEGFSGGYAIDEKYFIPSIAFKENEILYLLICLKLGEIIKVPNMKEAYESLKYKLLNILDEDTKRKYVKLLSRIKFYINYILPSDYKDNVMKCIIDSFVQCKNLSIEYYTPKKDECVKRTITPYALSFDSGAWYIDSYCHLRKSNRIFRIDRIRSISISEESYEESIIDDYIKSNDKKDEMVKVILQMNKFLYETVKNDYIFINAEKKICSDKIELQFYTNDLDKIINLAFRNYEEIKIIEPKECINKLKHRCKKILDIY